MENKVVIVSLLFLFFCSLSAQNTSPSISKYKENSILAAILTGLGEGMIVSIPLMMGWDTIRGGVGRSFVIFLTSSATGTLSGYAGSALLLSKSRNMGQSILTGTLLGTGLGLAASGINGIAAFYNAKNRSIEWYFYGIGLLIGSSIGLVTGLVYGIITGALNKKNAYLPSAEAVSIPGFQISFPF